MLGSQRVSVTDMILSSLQDYSAEGKTQQHQAPVCPPAVAENISPAVLQLQVIYHIGDEHVFSTMKQSLSKVVHLLFYNRSG